MKELLKTLPNGQRELLSKATWEEAPHITPDKCTCGSKDTKHHYTCVDKNPLPKSTLIDFSNMDKDYSKEGTTRYGGSISIDGKPHPASGSDRSFGNTHEDAIFEHFKNHFKLSDDQSSELLHHLLDYENNGPVHVTHMGGRDFKLSNANSLKDNDHLNFTLE